VSRALYWRLSGFYFFYFAYLGAFAPYFSLYLDAAGFAAAQIGVLLAMPQLTRIVAPYLWGHLADRAGRRLSVMRITAVAGTVCYLGVFAGSSFAWLAVCLACWCFFWSAALPMMETTTLGHLGQRSADYGRIRLWGSIGFIAAVVGVGWLLDRTGVGPLLWIIGAVMVAMLAAGWLVPEAPSPPAHAETTPIGRILRRPDVAALIGACFLMAVAHGPYYTFFSLHVVAAGYSKTQVGWLWAVGVIAEIAVFAWMPALFRRFSVQQVLAASFAIAALRFLLIAWAVDQPVVLFLAQIMHAATFGSFHAAALSCVHRLFAGPTMARGQAVYSSLSFGLGGTLGGLGSGYAWDVLGPALTFTTAAACGAAGWLLLRAVPLHLPTR